VGVDITQAGDQQDIWPNFGPDVWGFNGTSGHNQSVATFTITEADLNLGDFFVTELDTFFFERGGGDSFEISIAPGTLADFGALGGDNFRLLEDGTFGWIVSTAPIVEVPEPGTAALGLMALGAMGLRIRRRQRA
jgi:MYXO-CTERM domain-containing protein